MTGDDNAYSGWRRLLHVLPEFVIWCVDDNNGHTKLTCDYATNGSHISWFNSSV